MNAIAIIEGEVYAVQKNDPNRKTRRQFKDILQTEVLLGDGKAEAGRDIHLSIKGGEYDAVMMGSTARVRITCNQDNDTILKAMETAEKLCEKAIKKYYPSMKEAVQQISEEIKDI